MGAFLVSTALHAQRRSGRSQVIDSAPYNTPLTLIEPLS
jgi:crotonobetainyl-CoA:carnitine CoA-transferase CaiB-like acyl-CoA transferase